MGRAARSFMLGTFGIGRIAAIPSCRESRGNPNEQSASRHKQRPTRNRTALGKIMTDILSIRVRGDRPRNPVPIHTDPRVDAIFELARAAVTKRDDTD
jgi:hypothetical protein